MTTGRLVEELEGIALGEHLHLDAVLADPPVPGSPDWIPMLTDLALHLATMDGCWFISLPLGEVAPERVAVSVLESPFDVITSRSIEPPSVHRVHDRLATPWPGQELSETRWVGPGVAMTTSLSRSPTGREHDESWNATVTFTAHGDTA